MLPYETGTDVGEDSEGVWSSLSSDGRCWQALQDAERNAPKPGPHRWAPQRPGVRPRNHNRRILLPQLLVQQERRATVMPGSRQLEGMEILKPECLAPQVGCIS